MGGSSVHYNKPLIIVTTILIIVLPILMGACVRNDSSNSQGAVGSNYPTISSIKSQVMISDEVTILSSIIHTDSESTEPIVPDVSGVDVVVLIQTDNFKVIDMMGEPAEPGVGHIHYFLDTVPPVYPNNPALSAPGTVVEVAATSYTWPNVLPGLHVLSVELVNNDHTPLSPPAVASVILWVPDEIGYTMPQIVSLNTEVIIPALSPSDNIPSTGASETTTNLFPDTTSAPAVGADPKGVNVKVSIESANINPAAEQGLQTISGESHIHYYFDVIPPVFSFQTSLAEGGDVIHTIDNAYTWVDVKPGMHLFAAELVNNDHSPLNPPVAAASLITIMPQSVASFVSPSLGNIPLLDSIAVCSQN